MAKTGNPILDPSYLADIARARGTDGAVPGGLERVVKMATAAARAHEAKTLGDIRPDLADEDVDFHANSVLEKRRLMRALIRPTGPVSRLSKVGVVVRRMNLGLEGDKVPEL